MVSKVNKNSLFRFLLFKCLNKEDFHKLSLILYRTEQPLTNLSPLVGKLLVFREARVVVTTNRHQTPIFLLDGVILSMDNSALQNSQLMLYSILFSPSFPFNKLMLQNISNICRSFGNKVISASSGEYHTMIIDRKIIKFLD